MGTDVSPGPIFLRKRGGFASDVSSGLIFLTKKKKKKRVLLYQKKEGGAGKNTDIRYTIGRAIVTALVCPVIGQRQKINYPLECVKESI